MRRLLHPSLAVALSAQLFAAPTVRAAREGMHEVAEPPSSPGELFSSGRYLEAADAFGAAFEETGDPAMLFGRATALRRAGDCAGSIEAFELFVATGPPAADVDEARRVIEACEEILESTAPPPMLPQADPSPPPPRVVSPQQTNEGVGWPRDAAGGALLGAGVTVAVAGAVVLGVGASRARDTQESEAAFERRERSVRSLRAAGATMLVAGGALLLGSVIRYVVVARRQ